MASVQLVGIPVLTVFWVSTSTSFSDALTVASRGISSHRARSRSIIVDHLFRDVLMWLLIICFLVLARFSLLLFAQILLLVLL